MLQTVRIVNDRKEALSLTIGEITNGVYIKDIDGIDPVKATLVTSGLAGQDGLQYQASRREARNIIMKLGVELADSYGSVRSVRSELLRFFMPKSQINIQFTGDDMPSVTIAGRVEDFDFPIFTADPEVAISIMCFDPDFQELATRGKPGETNPGSLNNYIEYDGTVETGLTFKMAVDRPIDGFEIFHKPADGTTRSLKYSGDLKSGDTIEIVTERGKKRATLYRGGIKTSVLYAVDPQSEWLNLFPGQNNFVVYLEGNPITYTISYKNRYGSL